MMFERCRTRNQGLEENRAEETGEREVGGRGRGREDEGEETSDKGERMRDEGEKASEEGGRTRGC